MTRKYWYVTVANPQQSTVWYWDGRKSWYTTTRRDKSDPLYNPAEFTPEGMRMAGYYELLDDPFVPAELMLQEGL